jgi:predicted heme/steroid binding protein
MADLMELDERQLKRFDGEGGRPKYVAYAGVVYDVSDCPKWRAALHEGLHFPGQDLTDHLVDAPHDAAVFDRPCVKRVGRLNRASPRDQS